MVMAADLSCREGMLGEADVARTRDLLLAANLPVRGPAGLTIDEYLDKMALDKKNVDARLRLVLLRKLGEAIVTSDFSSEHLRATLSHCSDT